MSDFDRYLNLQEGLGLGNAAQAIDPRYAEEQIAKQRAYAEQQAQNSALGQVQRGNAAPIDESQLTAKLQLVLIHSLLGTVVSSKLGSHALDELAKDAAQGIVLSLKQMRVFRS